MFAVLAGWPHSLIPRFPFWTRTSCFHTPLCSPLARSLALSLFLCCSSYAAAMPLVFVAYRVHCMYLVHI